MARARLRVPGGRFRQCKGGDDREPSHVYSLGRAPPSRKASLRSWKGRSWAVAVAVTVARIARQANAARIEAPCGQVVRRLDNGASPFEWEPLFAIRMDSQCSS